MIEGDLPPLAGRSSAACIDAALEAAGLITDAATRHAVRQLASGFLDCAAIVAAACPPPAEAPPAPVDTERG